MEARGNEGKPTSKWTAAQEKYLPALQSGAKFETIGASKIATRVEGFGGGQVLDVTTVAAKKFDFQKEFSSTYIRRPKGDASKAERIEVVKDKDGKVIRQNREPYPPASKNAGHATKVDAKEPHLNLHEPKVHIKEPHIKLKGKE